MTNITLPSKFSLDALPKAPNHSTANFATLLAQHVGVMADWATVLPTYEAAQAAYDALPPEVRLHLIKRCAYQGVDPVAMMQRVPETLWENPEYLSQWMNMMDLSHIEPKSHYPEMADDPNNIIWELSSPNRARGAKTMKPEEYRDATDHATDSARDLTGDQTWWDLNDVFRGFLDFASFLGYSGATIPKSVWLEMMNTIRSDLPLIDNEKTFAGKLRQCRKFVHKVSDFFAKHKMHIAAAFLLGMLCVFWPPAAFFMAVWAVTGLFGIAVDIMQRIAHSTSKKFRFFRFLQKIDVSLTKLQHFFTQARNLLTWIKDGVYYATKVATDVVFSALNKFWKNVVKPAVAKIIKKAKDLLTGFLNWIFGRQPQVAYA